MSDLAFTCKLYLALSEVEPPDFEVWMYQGATQIGGRGPGGAGGDAASVLKIYQSCTA